MDGMGVTAVANSVKSVYNFLLFSMESNMEIKSGNWPSAPWSPSPCWPARPPSGPSPSPPRPSSASAPGRPCVKIDWLIDLLIRWLIDQWINWSVDWFIDQLINWFIDQLINWFIDQLIDLLIQWYMYVYIQIDLSNFVKNLFERNLNSAVVLFVSTSLFSDVSAIS